MVARSLFLAARSLPGLCLWAPGTCATKDLSFRKSWSQNGYGPGIIIIMIIIMIIIIMVVIAINDNI